MPRMMGPGMMGPGMMGPGMMMGQPMGGDFPPFQVRQTVLSFSQGHETSWRQSQPRIEVAAFMRSCGQKVALPSARAAGLHSSFLT